MFYSQFCDFLISKGVFSREDDNVFSDEEYGEYVLDAKKNVNSPEVVGIVDSVKAINGIKRSSNGSSEFSLGVKTPEGDGNDGVSEFSGVRAIDWTQPSYVPLALHDLSPGKFESKTHSAIRIELAGKDGDRLAALESYIRFDIPDQWISTALKVYEHFGYNHDYSQALMALSGDLVAKMHSVHFGVMLKKTPEDISNDIQIHQSNNAMAKLVDESMLYKYVFSSPGVIPSNPHNKATFFEAILGLIYYMHGMKGITRFAKFIRISGYDDGGGGGEHFHW